MCDPGSKGCGRRRFPLSHNILLKARDLSTTERKTGRRCMSTCLLINCIVFVSQNKIFLFFYIEHSLIKLQKKTSSKTFLLRRCEFSCARDTSCPFEL